MAQFDVRRNLGANARTIPYLLELQSDLLDDLAVRVFAPLVLRSAMSPLDVLNPVFDIEGTPVVMSTQEIAAVPRTELPRDVVANLSARDFEIKRAIDFLFLGF